MVDAIGQQDVTGLPREHHGAGHQDACRGSGRIRHVDRLLQRLGSVLGERHLVGCPVFGRQVRQLGGAVGTISGKTGEHDVVDVLRHPLENSCDILVTHRCEHGDEGVEVEGLSETGKGRIGTMRVVEGVQDDGWGPSHQFQTGRGTHLCQTLLDDVGLERPGERLGGGNGEGSVACHVFPEQGQVQLPQWPGSCLQTQHLTADCPTTLQQTEVRPLEHRSGTHLLALRQQDGGRLRFLTSNDRHRPRLDDSRLLRGNLLQAVTQDVHVIHRHRADDADVAVGHIRRVPAAAQTNLDDHDVHRGIGEGGEGHRRDDLEECHLDAVDLLFVDHLDHRLDLFPGLVEHLVADGRSVDADPLIDVDQVWRRVTSHPQTGSTQQGLNHERSRTLAIGAGDVDHRAGTLGIAQQVEEGLLTAEPRTDPVLRPSRLELCHQIRVVHQ